MLTKKIKNYYQNFTLDAIYKFKSVSFKYLNLINASD